MSRFFQSARSWWKGADENSLTFLLRGITAYFLGWMVLPLVGIDRLTTVDNFTMLSVAFCCIACVLGAVFGSRAWFGFRDDEPVGARRRMKRDQHGKWLAGGFLSVSLPALILTYTTYRFTEVAAQLLPGASLQYRGNITKVRRFVTARNPCRVAVSIELTNAQGDTTFCLTTAGFGAMDSISVAVGDPVILNEKRGLFGQAVMSVEHAPH